MTTTQQLSASIERRRPALPGWSWLRQLRHNPALLAGLVILFGWVLATLLAPLLTPAGPNHIFADASLQPPSAEFPFGTDERGRDMLARVLYGFRYDMLIALLAIALSIAGGLLMGSIAANSGPMVDNIVMRCMDVLFAFPSFVLALMLAGALGPSMWNLIIAIGVVFLPLYARLVRGSMLAEREKQYVEAAHGIGVGKRRLIALHLLPNSLGPVITQSTMNVSWAIMTIAGISFLGFGIQPPTPEWGLLISDGASFITTGQWWLSFFPGLAILSLVTGLIMIDDGMRQRD